MYQTLTGLVWLSVRDVPDTDGFVEHIVLDLVVNQRNMNLLGCHLSHWSRMRETNLLEEQVEVALISAIVLQRLLLSLSSDMREIRRKRPYLIAVWVAISGHQGKPLADFDELIDALCFTFHRATIVCEKLDITICCLRTEKSG